MKKKTPIQKNKNFLIILLSSILILGLSFLFISQKQTSEDNKDRSETLTNLQNTNKVLATHPPITKWQKYIDLENESFSFEFPSFVDKFTDITSRSRYSGTGIQDVQEVINGDIKYWTSHIWEVEELNYGNYEHRLYMQVTGPINNTSNISIKDWIESMSWPSEGEIEETGGNSKVSEINLDGSKAIVSVFKERESKYPRGWRIYFKTELGIYYIDISVQGTEKELEAYQPIFSRILSTFRFID